MAQRHTHQQQQPHQQQQTTGNAPTGWPSASAVPPASSSLYASGVAPAVGETSRLAGWQQQPQPAHGSAAGSSGATPSAAAAASDPFGSHPSPWQPSSSDPLQAHTLHTLRLQIADLESRAAALAHPPPKQQLQSALENYLAEHLAPTLKHVLADMVKQEHSMQQTEQRTQKTASDAGFAPLVRAQPPPASVLSARAATSAAPAAAAAAVREGLRPVSPSSGDSQMDVDSSASVSSSSITALRAQLQTVRDDLSEAESELLSLDPTLSSPAARVEKLQQLSSAAKLSLVQRKLKTAIEFIHEQQAELESTQRQLNEAEQAQVRAMQQQKQQQQQQQQQRAQELERMHQQQLQQLQQQQALQMQQHQQQQQAQQLSTDPMQRLLDKGMARKAIPVSNAGPAFTDEQLRALANPEFLALLQQMQASGGAAATQTVQQQPQPAAAAAAAPALAQSHRQQATPDVDMHGAGSGGSTAFAGFAAASPHSSVKWESPSSSFSSSSSGASASASAAPRSAPAGSGAQPTSYAEAKSFEKSPVPPELEFLYQTGFRAFDFTYRTSAVNHVKSLLRDKLRLGAAELSSDVWHFESRYNLQGIQEWRSYVAFRIPSSFSLASGGMDSSREFRSSPSGWYLVKTQSTEESAISCLKHMRTDTQLKNLFLRPVPPVDDLNPISALRNAVRDRSLWGKSALLEESLSISGSEFLCQLTLNDQLLGSGRGSEKVLAKTNASIHALQRWNDAINFIREKEFEQLRRVQWLELDA